MPVLRHMSNKRGFPVVGERQRESLGGCNCGTGSAAPGADSVSGPRQKQRICQSCLQPLGRAGMSREATGDNTTSCTGQPGGGMSVSAGPDDHSSGGSRDSGRDNSRATSCQRRTGSRSPGGGVQEISLGRAAGQAFVCGPRTSDHGLLAKTATDSSFMCSREPERLHRFPAPCRYTTV
jgi:hypothetical protein